MTTRHVVARLAEIPPGSRKRVEVAGRPVAIFNIGGELFGLIDRCPHQGAKLSEGRLIGLVEAWRPGEYRYAREGEILRCPWHGWEFDLRTGRTRCEPGRVRARSVPVSVAPPDPETVRVAAADGEIVVEI